MQQRNPVGSVHASLLPQLLRVVGGIILGISSVYLVYYAEEIFSVTHTLDLHLLSVLMLMGVPVLLIGWLDHESSVR